MASVGQDIGAFLAGMASGAAKAHLAQTLQSRELATKQKLSDIGDAIKSGDVARVEALAKDPDVISIYDSDTRKALLESARMNSPQTKLQRAASSIPALIGAITEALRNQQQGALEGQPPPEAPSPQAQAFGGMVTPGGITTEALPQTGPRPLGFPTPPVAPAPAPRPAAPAPTPRLPTTAAPPTAPARLAAPPPPKGFIPLNALVPTPSFTINTGTANVSISAGKAILSPAVKTVDENGVPVIRIIAIDPLNPSRKAIAFESGEPEFEQARTLISTLTGFPREHQIVETQAVIFQGLSPELRDLAIERLQQDPVALLTRETGPGEAVGGAVEGRTTERGVAALRRRREKVERETTIFNARINQMKQFIPDVLRGAQTVRKVDDVIDKFAAVDFPNSPLSGAIRLAIQRNPFFQTTIESISDLFSPDPKTGQSPISRLSEAVIDPAALGPLSREEIEFLTAWNFLLVDVTDFVGEPRTSDEERAVAMRALGQGFLISPDIALAQLIQTRNVLARKNEFFLPGLIDLGLILPGQVPRMKDRPLPPRARARPSAPPSGLKNRQVEIVE